MDYLMVDLDALAKKYPKFFSKPGALELFKNNLEFIINYRNRLTGHIGITMMSVDGLYSLDPHTGKPCFGATDPQSRIVGTMPLTARHSRILLKGEPRSLQNGENKILKGDVQLHYGKDAHIVATQLQNPSSAGDRQQVMYYQAPPESDRESLCITASYV